MCISKRVMKEETKITVIFFRAKVRKLRTFTSRPLQAHVRILRSWYKARDHRGGVKNIASHTQTHAFGSIYTTLLILPLSDNARRPCGIYERRLQRLHLHIIVPAQIDSSYCVYFTHPLTHIL